MGWIGNALIVLVLAGSSAWSPSAHAAWEAANAAFSQFEFERAAAAEALTKADSSAAERHADAARRHLHEAKAAFEAAGIRRSQDDAARSRYVEVLGTLGDHDLAGDFLQSWIVDGGDTPERQLALGEAWLACGPTHREAAFAALTSARERGGDDVRARAVARLGDLYYREGLYEHAEAAYTQALEANAEDVETRIALAALKARAGDLAGASAALDAIGMAAQPHDAFTRERLRDALYDFDAQRRWFPDSVGNQRAYARLLYRAARLPEAVMAARRATELDAGDAPTWNFLAAMHLQMGQTEQGAAAYERSLQADPNQPQVRVALERLRATAAEAAR